MTKKNRLLMGLVLVFAVLAVAGITAAAVSNFGTESNPLVTKSYIDNVVAENILKELDTSISAQADKLKSDFNEQIENFSGGGSATGTPSSFEVLTLKNNQVIRCSVGTQILLRSGSATCYGGDSPRLVNTTNGTTLDEAGSALTANNMYLVSIENNGLRAREDGTVILISGTYTIYDNL